MSDRPLWYSPHGCRLPPLRPDQNLPVPSTYERVSDLLRAIAELVEAGDSWEGSVEWSIPLPEDALPPPVSDADQPEVMVRAAFRIGNTQGQGGMRIIGTLGRTA